ncbi:MAG: hypothetical protein ABSH37_08750 [Bryobacteraceae bacterium]
MKRTRIQVDCRTGWLRPMALLPLALAAASLPGFGQQAYVSRFDLFTGYTYLDSPVVSLRENGFQFQAGVRLNTWVSLGFDYSVSAGTLTLTPNLLATSLRQQLGTELGQLAAAGEIPSGYNLIVPAHSRTQTFAGGPQFSYRHFSKVTLFIRPSAGAIHEYATPQPGDPIAAAIAAQLAPAGHKVDTVVFYGFGGGVDFSFSKHVGLRVQADFVHDHLFSDLLQNGRNTVRLSIGPCFNFGNNVAR